MSKGSDGQDDAKDERSVGLVEWIQKKDSRRWDYRHQNFLFNTLRRVTDGEVKRLMIFMPPRHGKSETVTVRYAAWRLLREPKLRIIIGCYNQKLANKFSRMIRRQIDGEIEMAKDQRAVDEWETAKGGGVKAVGVGAGITGFGGHLIIIDDPVKSRGQAESRRRRDAAWDWYTDDVFTRLEPGGAIIVIQTRWHVDDLAGRIRKDAANGGEKWDIVELPAIALEDDQLDRSPGEALWPERFDIDTLEEIRRLQGTYAFDALYQQRPVQIAGNIFKRDWFRHIVRAAPPGLRWARGYDLAVSTRTTADYTATFRCAYDAEQNLYIADGHRKRIEFPEQRILIKKLISAEANTSHGIEKALHGMAIIQDLLRDRDMRGKHISAVRPDTDKVTRALAWSSAAEAGKLRLVEGVWNQDFIEEACAFPDSEYDDQIDAVSIAVNMLTRKSSRIETF